MSNHFEELFEKIENVEDIETFEEEEEMKDDESSWDFWRTNLPGAYEVLLILFIFYFIFKFWKNKSIE